ncbi:MAG TPA: hypothetical protein VGQ46_19995 [Thermoanaerobaculia bacterium]|jgi:PKD repeat protein|nr:hypothetical protein [Thermoanaerobaculia bacterium]
MKPESIAILLCLLALPLVTLSPAHTYASKGTYHWTLTLTAASGETCSSSGNITITAPTVPPKRRAVSH